MNDAHRNQEEFDISQYTTASLRMAAMIKFEGKTPADVFDLLGDPEAIPKWYPLAKGVNVYPPENDKNEGGKFSVDFLFFGEVYEEVFHWDPPHRYVYKAVGDDFPIKDYVAMIEVKETAPGKGTFKWEIYCDHIEGVHYQKVLPIILPPITEEGLKCLSPMIGGISWNLKSYF
jgi:uncharacterized protein YndB with AHSA1/START domain